MRYFITTNSGHQNLKRDSEAYKKGMEGHDHADSFLKFCQKLCIRKLYQYVSGTLYDNHSICVELRKIFNRYKDICEKKGARWSKYNTLQGKPQKFQIWWSRNYTECKDIVSWVKKDNWKSCNISNEKQLCFWRNCKCCSVTTRWH